MQHNRGLTLPRYVPCTNTGLDMLIAWTQENFFARGQRLICGGLPEGMYKGRLLYVDFCQQTGAACLRHLLTTPYREKGWQNAMLYQMTHNQTQSDTDLPIVESRLIQDWRSGLDLEEVRALMDVPRHLGIASPTDCKVIFASAVARSKALSVLKYI